MLKTGPVSIKSAALMGIEALSVEVEVDVLAGLPSFTLVGLGDKTVQESKERLAAALTNAGYQPPRKKTIVSLAPASLKKEGSLYDLPIAIGLLVASGQVAVRPEALVEAWIVGELGLDGTVRPVRGVMPMLLAARKKGIKELYVPFGNLAEAEVLADKLKIYAVKSLQELVLHLSNEGAQAGELKPLIQRKKKEVWEEPEIDFADIKGQEYAKRALLIAASSAHNVLMVGAPGSGKTLLARALAGILPTLTREESYIVTSLYSIAGLLVPGQGLIRRRPFRSPHHGASSVALVGGGISPRPGEVSLAHGGVLFLDELPEFSRHVLDQLRQPIEDGVITVARSSATVRFPARSILVGAMNPCQCGYLGSDKRSCQCAPGEILRYQRRVSGPLLDRFDIHVVVTDVSLEELLADARSGPTSQELAQAAAGARGRQLARQGKLNAELHPKEIKKFCDIGKVGMKLLMGAQDKFQLSSRGVHRLLKVSRTIADLGDKEYIAPEHLAEALQYREQLKVALPLR